MTYITRDCKFPPFIPCPVSLLAAPLSDGAKMAYLALLHRVSLSRKNNLADEEGRIFVIYPVEHLAADLGKGETAAYRILQELEKGGYLVRRRKGFCRPNQLYLRIDTSIPSENGRSMPSENSSSDLPKTEVQKSRNPKPNNKDNNNKYSNNKEAYAAILSFDLFEEAAQ